MNDLHKPLGKTTSGASVGRDWLLPVLGIAGVCLLSLAAYVFIDARQSVKTVVAINDAPVTETAPAAESDAVKQADEAVSATDGDDQPFDVTKVKPLSPLLPLEGEAPSAPKPAFKPSPMPKQQRSEWMPVPDLVEKSEFGPLPRISDGGIRPLDAYSLSSGVTGANRVAIILGGLGLSQTGTQAAIKTLPSSITMGFSPFGNSLQRWMQEARKEGHEVILQLPMEPLGYPAINPGPHTLTSTASAGENLMNLRWALGRMTNYPAVMNYLGSGLTSKPTILRPILEEIRGRGLAYIDDGSASASTAIELADSMRLPHARGTMIIDAERNADRIRSSLSALEALAKDRGFAIGSATAFPETVEVLNEWAKQAQQRNIIIVPVSNLLRDFSR